MERKQVPESEQKLILLLVLEVLGPVTETQLLRFLAELSLMNWFEMRLNMNDLADEGYVVLHQHPAGSLRQISDAGKECLRAFENRIPYSRKKSILETGEKLRLVYLREQQTPVEVLRLSDGRECLRLRLTEQDRLLMDFVFALPAGCALSFPDRRWQAVAPEIWKELMGKKLVTEECEKDPLCSLMVFLEDETPVTCSLPVCREIAAMALARMAEVDVNGLWE